MGAGGAEGLDGGRFWVLRGEKMDGFGFLFFLGRVWVGGMFGVFVLFL